MNALSATVAIVLSAQAHAQELPEAPAAPAVVDLSTPDPLAPTRKPIPSATVVFVDYGLGEGILGDCDPLRARQGRCVEYVSFLDPPRPGEPAAPRSIGVLYGQLQDELAMRWARAENNSGEPIMAAGFTDAGLPQERWKRVRSEDGAEAVPTPATWLDSRVLSTPTGLTPPIAWHQPAPLVGRVEAPPTLVRLTGRFALRLGHNGRPFPHELMDGDARSSAPFFEQMYPYSTSREDQSLQGVPAPTAPLQPFQEPERLLDTIEALAPGAPIEGSGATVFDHPIVVSPDLDISTLASTVHAQFDDFARLLGVTIASYASADHTLNQMRVLTSLTAMRRHPGPPDGAAGAGRRLVAAARGETDGEDAVSAELDRTAYALRDGFRLRLDWLPDPVVSYWMARLWREQSADKTLTPALIEQWQAGVTDMHRRVLRAGAPPIPDMAEATIEAWVQQAMEAGAAREAVARATRLYTLRTLLDNLSPARRDQVETWVLLDHVDEDLHVRMERLGEGRATPDEVTDLGQTAWRTVLDGHGHVSQPVPQGRRAVDPTAICTTRPGREALTEPAFGAATVDLLVLASEDAEGPDSVLAEIRHNTPFLFVDDPSDNIPDIARLIDVPGPKAIYRVRWRVWTGWHLLWGVQPVAAAHDRLVPWTAAICEDMVLAAPDLVPTLTRAGLLDGRLLPTEPMRGSDVRSDQRADARDARQRNASDPASREVEADQKADSTRKGLERALQLKEDAKEQGIGVAANASGTTGAERQVQQLDADNGVVQAQPSDAATYLRDLVRGMLTRSDGRTDGALIYAMHLDHSDRVQRTGLVPHTPYATTTHRSGKGHAIRTSAWATVIDPIDKPRPGVVPDVLSTLVSPAYNSTDQLSVDENPRPSWRRVHPLDWTLTGSLGGFPVRNVRYTCTVQPEDLDVLAPCPEDLLSRNSEGLSTDIGGLMTLWWLDRPRMAIEWGAEAHLDLMRPGWTRWFAGRDDYGDRAEVVEYGWTLRPAGGLVAGLRYAPRPTPLHTGSPDGRLWGVQRTNAAALASRTQVGVRVGALFGPGYNGTEMTLTPELWMGWSVRRPQGPRAAVTPHHPALIVGPYVRGQFAWVVPGLELYDDGQPRYQALDRSAALLVGARVHVRVNQKVSPPAAQ